MFPVAFHGVLAAASGYAVMNIYCFWTVDRKDRAQPVVFSALIYTMVFNFFWLIINNLYWLVTIFYTKAPRSLQFLVALIFEGLLVACMFSAEFLFKKLDSSASFLGYHMVYMNHAVYLAVVIGSSADWITTVAVVAADNISNIHSVEKVLSGRGMLDYYLPRCWSRCRRRRFEEPHRSSHLRLWW